MSSPDERDLEHLDRVIALLKREAADGVGVAWGILGESLFIKAEMLHEVGRSKEAALASLEGDKALRRGAKDGCSFSTGALACRLEAAANGGDEGAAEELNALIAKVGPDDISHLMEFARHRQARKK